MQDVETVVSVSLYDLPVAKLQIVQAPDVVKSDWLCRSDIEPKLTQNADGLWLLSVRRQGEHSKFDVPYIGSEILLADAEFGLIVVLVGYHGSSTEKYGRLGYMTQKGQFYRYYQQEAAGDWKQVCWPRLNDELRALILETVEEKGPQWARSPGKLQSERKPPTKHVILTSYKVVRFIGDRYFSLYQPDVEYILGQRMKQPAKAGHKGGYFSFPTLEQGQTYLEGNARCFMWEDATATPAIALLECEIGGRIINYGHKMASTYLTPIKVLEIRACMVK